MDKLEPFMVYPGSKWKLAPWIIEQFPKHTSYLEPFCGSAAVFLQKPRSPIEILNDLNGDVYNLLKVIRDNLDDLLFGLECTPWSREEFELSYDREGLPPVERARRYMVHCWQSYGMKQGSKTGWKCDASFKCRKYYASSWKRIPERVLKVVDRFRDAQLENQSALEIIKRYSIKSSSTLIYADPPYMLSTRDPDFYAFDLNNLGHETLLRLLCDHPGPVVLSGLDHPLYEHYLGNWKKLEKQSQTRSGSFNTEVLWIKEAVR